MWGGVRSVGALVQICRVMSLTYADKRYARLKIQVLGGGASFINSQTRPRHTSEGGETRRKGSNSPYLPRRAVLGWSRSGGLE